MGNIEKFPFWINSLRKAHPDIVVTPLQVLWLGKGKSLSDNAATVSSLLRPFQQDSFVVGFCL